jgi:signal transduction histidine kinase/CheY-like chemotaxis protein
MPGGHLVGEPAGSTAPDARLQTNAGAALVAPATGAKVTPPSGLGTLPEEVRSLYAFLPSARFGFIAGVSIVALSFWGMAPVGVLAAWLGAFAVMGAARLAVEWRYRRAAPQTRRDWLRWRRLFGIGTLLAGALLGLTGWIFYPLGGPVQQTVLIVVIFAFAVAAVSVLATQPPLFLSFVTFAFAPLMVRIAGVGTLENMQLAATLVLIIVMTTMLAHTYRRSVQRVIELKSHAEGLLEQLKIEKRSAEAARRQAEAANRAKTQFFTAASHDLRQPLHAMGLFAEALRQRVHEPETAQMVNSINESVDALEGLFSELLDITRIDSGGVEVQARPFVLDDIFRRLRLHFEPIAFDKGLALRLRGGNRMALADPVLVERILRNLVSNAIRYTEDGGVLVACRRRGNHLWLQVWDTGRGIPADQQAMVFEEFYQVPQADATAAHQRKGLGLGLAIVRRLAALMDAPLRLASQPGRGTVFTLELPLGRDVGQHTGAPRGKTLVELTLNGRLIVVVEDEPAVRLGLEVLLKGWGAEVVSFDSVASAGEWALHDEPAASRRPDLFIVDFRLEDGATGVDALRMLRGRFGRSVPAVVVTGSMLTGHEREAHEHDFHILVKPVLPNKLRAMISFKLGVKQQAVAG